MRVLSLAVVLGFFVSLSSAARADCQSEEGQIRQLLQRQTRQLTGDSICHTARDAESVFREVLAFYERCSINDPGGEMRRSMRESISWAAQTQSSVCAEQSRTTTARLDQRMVAFAMADAERSKAMNEQRLDAEGRRSAVSAAAMENLLQQQMASATQAAHRREQLDSLDTGSRAQESRAADCRTSEEIWAACRVPCPPDVPDPAKGCTDIRCFQAGEQERTQCWRSQ